MCRSFRLAVFTTISGTSNYRVLMTMGADLLAHGMAREVEQLDEKLYLEVYQPNRPLATSKKKARV